MTDALSPHSPPSPSPLSSVAPDSPPASHGGLTGDEAPDWGHALALSRWLRQLLAGHPEIGDWLHTHAGAPVSESLMLANLAAAADGDESAQQHALRVLRQRVMATLAVRDLAGVAPLSEVMETMTLLAEVTVNFALAHAHRALVQRFGEPLDSNGVAQRLLVIGMGKLGGRELNVSSDVDFIFVYPEEGHTAGRADGSGVIDAYDFFNRLGKRLIAALGEITADGQVFRVDMRLRPNGDSGPLVCSLDALENYFVTQGREWERYAWIKARVLNAGDNLQAEWVLALEHIARPFIYRKYLDFGAINAMRDLHAQIRREVARRDMADHIKLGPGGIREIEFIAQAFQLIRGGRDSGLRIRPTLATLAALAQRRQLPEAGERELALAYDFLRRLEHRLQYVDDAQTHRLPAGEEERAQIALAMHYPDWNALVVDLDAHRARVAHHFELVFSEPAEAAHALTGLWQGHCDSETALDCLAGLGFRDPKGAGERLQQFRASGRYQQLPASNRERLDALGPRLLAAAAATRAPDATWRRGLDFLETISGRGAYLALLQQYPQALQKVGELVGSSSWAAEYLTRHPILLDELLDSRLYELATDWDGFRSELAARLAENRGDTEREMDLLRELHHAQVFRLLTQDLAGLQSVARISDHLSQLADILLQTTLDLCWSKLTRRHREQPKFAVIGFGKLGGKELGYGSDLDIVFIHDDDDQEAGAIYSRLAQRMISWLSSRTPAGILFETDLRLRPNGDAGLMVSPLAALHDYERDHAWVWEHQALTRARFCAGDAELGERFEAMRIDILRQPREHDTLRREVLAMRQRMLDAHASGSDIEFDIKQDPGGIIDVEFIVQYLILGHAHAHADLCRNIGNIALLRLAAELGLISPTLAEAVREAYRHYRRLQHAKRLDGVPAARVERAAMRADIDAVRALWREVFDDVGED
ncbi:bifunctional [glutamate--ammonia ligase]-adenylyl-L-tyrosine phosphorylase/[glutamate--ammonia-ligase] adenylyltransferase [Rhodocyclus gracilis]|uniref:Bifunctional glutamine synthetase adenylyltransferase/adenylyl-removing enzyme n=1 Tax=Rhodocyclus tenuis TaxID=1066 RepID=A0A6L5JU24_RHOTE|nr:bifunctional [glutamate--ammonia ligase]-adenylyl-L-tyrosine phosphorylase/[glutamate--ammonia-ligase] adenylyltransferase [Rhodocyclus gracilis]MQY50606.1 bifunctional [glutamate--ammonia ligase]-adenylyl-L-tyrosine phosphorylase/[glutamate--ammonia-ligase] adenylyltransferase [Rhodocyclus gracilis]